MLKIIQLRALNDNYIYLVHESRSGDTVVVDPAISQPVLDQLNSNNWSLKYILNTHHHWDHVGANLELKQQENCKILASDFDQSRIPGIDKGLKNGDTIKLGKQTINIIETPGHTLGHIVFHLPEENVLFSGDTLFSMGCGRLFEGSAEQMWHSLQSIKKLPKTTQIYCAHEYTQANAKFALTLEPDNQHLQQRIKQVNQLYLDYQPTIPTRLDVELAINPFLREHSLPIQQSLNMVGASSIEIFSRIRGLKDDF